MGFAEVRLSLSMWKEALFREMGRRGKEIDGIRRDNIYHILNI